MSLNIYAEEREKIYKVGVTMQEKWDDLTRYKLDRLNTSSKKNVDLMQSWADETVRRYLEAGFKVTVDITPALANIKPPNVTIDDRVAPELTDYDRIIHDVKKENT